MLPAFESVVLHPLPLPDAIAHEAMWMEAAALWGQAGAHLWQGPPGWVVPRRYTQLAGWAGARIEGELQVRASGGGLVPQGPGIWNLSLVWPAADDAPAHSTAVYRALCERLAAGLATLGLEASAGEVRGSFCDGRFNLAARGRKLVGTAQAWRRLQGRQIGLAHAVIVIDADPADLAQRANAVETALGNDTRYDSAAMTSVRLEAGGGDDIEERTLQALAACMIHHEENCHGIA